MADRKISDLTALTTPASGDYLPIVDISETAAASKNKRITVEELMRGAPDGTAASPGIAFESDPNTGIYSPGADQLAVSTGGTGRLFVDSSGRLLVGTSSAVILAPLEVNGNGSFGNYQDNDFCSGLRLYKSKSGTTGTQGLVANNTQLGDIRFLGSDGSSFVQGAVIRAEVDGTPGTNDMPGRLVFFTTADGASSPTERMRIDSQGSVGIGTTSPDTKLNVVQSSTGRAWAATGGNGDLIVERNGNAGLAIIGATTSDSALNFGDTDDENAGFIKYYHADDAMVFRTGGIGEDMRIDSSGRLLVGTSSARTGSASIIPSLQCESTAGSGSSSLFCRNSDSTSGPTLQFAKTRGTSNGSSTVVQSGDELGLILFSGADGTDIDSRGAQIGAYVDGTPGLDDMPGRLVFSTTADGSATPTERMRIDSSGRVGVGTSSPTTLLDVNADTVRVRTARTPASATATGATGEICWDASYIYVCTATNTWKRAALSTW